MVSEGARVCRRGSRGRTKKKGVEMQENVGGCAQKKKPKRRRRGSSRG